MDVPEYLRLKAADTRSMFGIAGKHSIGHGDWLFLDLLLSRRPQWTNFVELGTGSGLTTLFLGICAELRAGMLNTWDIASPNRQFADAWPACVMRHKESVLDDETPLLNALLTRSDTLLICDNGRKIEEVNRYAPLLKIGSGFVVHDWNSEIRQADIAPMLQDRHFQPLFHEEAEALQSKYRAWEK